MCDRLDIVIVLDASDEMLRNNPNNSPVDGRTDNWSILISKLIQMMYRIPISVYGTHIGAVTFGDSANVEIRLEEIFDANQLASRIRTIRASTLFSILFTSNYMFNIVLCMISVYLFKSLPQHVVHEILKRL